MLVIYVRPEAFIVHLTRRFNMINNCMCHQVGKKENLRVCRCKQIIGDSVVERIIRSDW